MCFCEFVFWTVASLRRSGKYNRDSVFGFLIRTFNVGIRRRSLFMPSSILISKDDPHALLICPFTALARSLPDGRRRICLPSPPCEPYQLRTGGTPVSRGRKKLKTSHDEPVLSSSDIQGRAHHESLKPWLGPAIEQVRQAWISSRAHEWWSDADAVKRRIKFEHAGAFQDDLAWSEWEAELGQLRGILDEKDDQGEPERLQGILAFASTSLSLCTKLFYP
jgi:hypothetical protein